MLAVIGFPALKGITNTITSGYMPIADNVPIWLRNEMPIFYFTLILTAVSVMIALIIFLLIHSLNIGIYQKNLRKYN
jgi:hypothetical protein